MGADVTGSVLPGPVADGPPDGALLQRLLVRAAVGTDSGVTIADATRPGFPLVWVNPAFERMTGYPAGELLGRGCALLQGPDTDPAAVRSLAAALRDGRDATVVLRNTTRSGTRWWNEVQLTPVRDEAGRVTHVLGFQRDVTARVQAEARVAHLATHDTVTGLPDRARLLDVLELELARARGAGHGLAVLVVELDGLRDLDADWSGLDLALPAVALRLRAVLRAGDVLGRLGAEQFAAVLPGVGAASVSVVAERVARDAQGTLAEPLDVPGLRLALRARVGVALAPGDAESPPALLSVARARCSAGS